MPIFYVLKFTPHDPIAMFRVVNSFNNMEDALKECRENSNLSVQIFPQNLDYINKIGDPVYYNPCQCGSGQPNTICNENSQYCG